MTDRTVTASAIAKLPNILVGQERWEALHTIAGRNLDTLAIVATDINFDPNEGDGKLRVQYAVPSAGYSQFIEFLEQSTKRVLKFIHVRYYDITGKLCFTHEFHVEEALCENVIDLSSDKITIGPVSMLKLKIAYNLNGYKLFQFVKEGDK